MHRMILAAALALTPMAALAETDAELDALKDRVVGSWSSIGCEIRPQAQPDGSIGATYLTRDFTYDDQDGFSASIKLFADPGCQMMLADYTFAGHIVWHGPNPASPGAYSQDYVLDRALTITPMMQPFADQLNSLPAGACGTEGFEVGKGTDILGVPCALLRYVDGSPWVHDHDLLLVREDTPNMLFMGGKHVDGTGFYAPEHRPVVGLQQPLIKVN